MTHLATIGHVPNFTASEATILRDVDDFPLAPPVGLPSTHPARRHAWLQAFRF